MRAYSADTVTLRRQDGEKHTCLTIVWDLDRKVHYAALTPAQMRRLAEMLTKAADRIESDRSGKRGRGARSIGRGGKR